ncbi:hypothetical protein HK101_010937 [Irineochytrium annulatum]|nr:hypothetical protein HK101_010937 [Irineochytrium annulatum]
MFESDSHQRLLLVAILALSGLSAICQIAASSINAIHATVAAADFYLQVFGQATSCIDGYCQSQPPCGSELSSVCSKFTAARVVFAFGDIVTLAAIIATALLFRSDTRGFAIISGALLALSAVLTAIELGSVYNIKNAFEGFSSVTLTPAFGSALYFGIGFAWIALGCAVARFLGQR